jgi:hypothetical protein
MAKRRKRKWMPVPDDRPMTEAEWQQMFKESDARAARYGDLLETLIDHPHRDEIIEKEMGWDDDGEEEEPPTEEELEQLRKDGFNSREEFEQWKIDTLNAACEAVARAEVDDDEEENDVEKLPVYNLAVEVGMEIHKKLGPYLKKHWSDEHEGYTSDVGERMGEVYSNSLVIGAKIAGGHGISYDDDSLCGAIVKFRIALDAARTCEHGLTALRDDKSLPAKLVDGLLPDLKQVIEMLELRIAAMRERVWWGKPEK